MCYRLEFRNGKIKFNCQCNGIGRELKAKTHRQSARLSANLLHKKKINCAHVDDTDPQTARLTREQTKNTKMYKSCNTGRGEGFCDSQKYA